MLLRYQRYIFQQLLMPFLVITLTLTGIVWLTQSLRFIDLIVNKGLDISTFLYLSVLLLPSLLSIILPIALLCAVIFSYHRLISDSEMIVLKTVGLSRMNLATPAIAIGILVALLGYLIALYLQPVSYRTFKETQAFIRDNYASLLLQEGVFNSPTEGLTVYIDDRSRDGTLKGIFVHDAREKNHPITMMAERGKLVQTDQGPRFNLENGSRQEISQSNESLAMLYFEKYPLDLSFYTKKQRERILSARERYLHELFSPKNVEISEAFIQKLRAEGHYRIAWPLYTITLALLAATILFSGQFSRRGQSMKVLTIACFSVAIIATAITLKTRIAAAPYLTPLIYLGAVLPFMICIWMLISNRIIMGEKMALLLQKITPSIVKGKSS